MATVDSNPNRTIIGIIGHSSRRHLVGLLVLGLVIIASLVWVALRNNNGPSAPEKVSHFLFIDPAKDAATLTDSSDKKLSTNAYTQGSYVNYEANTPGGGVLLSLNLTTDSEGYSFITKAGKTQALDKGAVSTLHSAIVIDSSHQIFFTGEDSVVLVVCPNNVSCKLETLNILTGKSEVVIDSGVKMTGGLSPVYLLGLSSNYQTAYLRVVGKGTLSQSPGALYQIDIKSHKVLKEIDLSQDIGYSVALAPNKQKLAYKTGGYNGPTTIHVLDLKTYKDSTAAWNNGQIADLPSGLAWSPDSSKILLHTLTIVLPPNTTDSSAKSVTLGYLDTSKMSITTLQTIQDPAHYSVTADGWADDGSVVYQVANATDTYNFTDNITNTVYKQALSSKQNTKIQTYGQLGRVIYW